MTIDTREFIVGDWVVDPELGEIRRGDEVVHLEPRVMEILVCLARRGGDVVSRKELTEAVWPDTFVEDQAVTRAIWQLRQALGGEKNEFLQTVPKHGYRLTVPVRAVGASPPVVTARHSRWWWLAVAVGLGLVVVAIAAVSSRWFRPAGSPRRIMLAVLPFQNLTGEGDQDYVCDGLTEDVTSRLGALQPERLGVIARTSSNAYKRTTKRIDQIARELNVDYLLEGSFRPSGDRLRITAQLIATRDQAHVWTQQYEDDRSDLLQLCDSVAQSVTEQVRQRVVPAARASAGAVAVPPEARRAYLKGRYSLDLGTGAGFEAARDFFKEAIDREPNYAAAWAGLATTYVMLANYNMSPPAEAQPQAKAAATKALGLDPDVADARPVLAGMKMEHDWDFDAAEREFRRAISDNPNSARAHQWYGALLSALGRFDEGIDELRRAQELDPVALRVGVDVGRAYYFARRYDEAERAYRNVIALDPKYSSAHSMLGLALLARRRHSEAIAELEEGAALLGAARYSNFLGYAYALAGRTQDARAMLARQIDVWNKRRVGASGVALTYVGLGDEDQAFAWLDAARNGREAAVVMLKAFPYWDAIRTDPRFSDLLRRIGLPR